MTTPAALVLERLGGGRYVAHWRARRWRFMFSDGSTIDVESHTDGSTLRAAVLKVRGDGLSIVGVAELDADPVTGEPRPQRERKA